MVCVQGVEAARGLFFQPGAELRRWQALVLTNSNVAMLQHGDSVQMARPFTVDSRRIRQQAHAAPRQAKCTDSVLQQTRHCHSLTLRNARSGPLEDCRNVVLCTRAATGDLHGADITSDAVHALLTQHIDQLQAADDEVTRDRFIPAALKQVAALRAAQVSIDTKRHVAFCLTPCMRMG